MKITGQQLIEVCNRLVGKAKASGERRLSARECAKRLGMTSSNFSRICPKLIAAGLKQVQITKDGRIGYLESSLDKLMLHAAEREAPIINEKFPLVKVGPGGRFIHEDNSSEPVVS